MLVLGIETATLTGSVALADNNGIIAEHLLNTEDPHSERLLKGIDQILTNAKLSIEACDGIAVSIGPGSFTGLRIGVVTAKTLAYTLQKPLTGVSTLEVLTHNLPLTAGFICPMIDARRKEVYTALYEWKGEKLEVILPEAVISPEKMLDTLACSRKTIFIGNGANLYKLLIQEKRKDKAQFAPEYLNYPKACVVANLGFQRINKKKLDSISFLVPNYLRLSDAEINWRN